MVKLKVNEYKKQDGTTGRSYKVSRFDEYGGLKTGEKLELEVSYVPHEHRRMTGTSKKTGKPYDFMSVKISAKPITEVEGIILDEQHGSAWFELPEKYAQWLTDDKINQGDRIAIYLRAFTTASGEERKTWDLDVNGENIGNKRNAATVTSSGQATTPFPSSAPAPTYEKTPDPENVERIIASCVSNVQWFKDTAFQTESRNGTTAPWKFIELVRQEEAEGKLKGTHTDDVIIEMYNEVLKRANL